MIRVLLCDDHTIVRDGVKGILAETDDIVIGGEAGNSSEAMAKLRDGDIDVVVLDISLPGKSGLDVLKDIKVLYPKLPVLMLSMHPEEHYAVRAIKAGASGYLTKMTASSELIEAIRRVAAGRRFVTESLAEQLANEFQLKSVKKTTSILSDRELQVLCMFAKGKSAREIAAELHISVKTVGTYRGRMLEKLKLRNVAEMVHYAYHEGLVE